MRVLCILDNGFEELEAVGTIALLRRAGIATDVVACHDITATGRFDITLSQLFDLQSVNIENYDLLFLPGGPHYQKLADNPQVMQILTYFMQNKMIAAICAAPTILGKAGLLKGKNYTCFTSMNEDFGGIYHDCYTITDGNLITGRSAAAVIDFSFAIIEALAGKAKADEIKASIYYAQIP